MSEYVCLAVVGARLKGDLEKTFTFAKFCEHMDEYILKNGWDVKKIKFVSGGAKGVDTFARKYCHTFGTPENMIELIPEWTNKVTGKYDKLAGLKRNTDIVEKCTHMIAFPDRINGTGTQDSARKARALNKPVCEIPLN